jgi:hypothetical protein
MPRHDQVSHLLAERLCRPQRVGIFGHRGVGKTTLLTMLYREAVGGRLPGLRLAAADARTADYLSDKILQLEAGQPLPATLAESELRFPLYRGETRVELLVKDYQGEHVELGREEPIREFLRDCDAVWLCLDAAGLSHPDARLRRQQEIEQLMEDYLAAEPQRSMERPVALVLTKADLLFDGPEAARGSEWAAAFDMVRHALETHCPHSGLFPVSSLGRASALQPFGLAEPLNWLVEMLQVQDAARLEKLFARRAEVDLLGRCVACFSGRYPGTTEATQFEERFRQLRRGRRRRRGLLGAAAAACVVLGLTAYDAVGYQQARNFEAGHPQEPAAALDHWQRYQSWHPTQRWLGPGNSAEDARHLQDLGRAAREQARGDRLAALGKLARNADADPEAAWQQFREFREQYPETEPADLDTVRTALKERCDQQAAHRARRAFDELETAERQAADLPDLITRANRFLRDFPGSAEETEVLRRREAYLLRLDERDIQAARDYSARQPLNFQTRREHYQNYLAKHPSGGAFSAEAEAALKAIDGEWDRYDFRAVRDLFLANPGHTAAWVDRCRSYRAVHPDGRFRAAAADLLRWSERITAPHDYRVVLRSGQFDRGVARFFSRGPKLSVELEVAGVRYGPSTICKNRYDPEWDFEFPRQVRWKSGDPVRIRVTEHSWADRVVLDLSSADGEPLALQLLAGEAWSGTNCLKFESDFALPGLPPVE